MSRWEKLEQEKATIMEAFHSSKELTAIKLEFTLESYLPGLAV